MISIKKRKPLLLLSHHLLAAFLVAALLTACSATKEDAVRDMVAPDQESYNIYVFWDGRITDYTELINEMLNVINSEAALETINIHNMTFISLGDQTQKYNYKELFDIEQSPTIIVLDNDGVVLQTNDPQDIFQVSE
ncbi:hypothetical protein [Paenibacillus senegalensis]|uniref:hypothetical protein n=1 Tax=Paenibacillus senegalensis TaxID=1465766 RepID=UPI0011DD95D5|nr:hypothetical protein [Paenibacillus senegalensis]